MADFLTLSEIRTAIYKATKDFNEKAETLVDMVINMVYVNEVMVCDPLRPLYWMMDMDDSLSSVAPSSLSGISQATDGVFTTSSPHGLVVGDLITVHNVSEMTEVNDKVFQVATVPSSTTFTTGTTTSSYAAYSSGGTVNHVGKTLSTSGKSIQRMWKVSWQGYTPPLEPITPDEIEENCNYHWKNCPSRPQRYYHGKTYASAGDENNQIIWYPGADAAYNLRYWFEERASRLVNTSDVPLLPPQFQYAIVAGAISRLAEYNVTVENQIIWPTLYSNQLEALRIFNRQLWEKYQVQEKPYLL